LITHYNLFLEKELLTLLDTFKANNIMAVPFKGPLLAVAIYGDMLLRECGDLDFLIKRKDVRIAINLRDIVKSCVRRSLGGDLHFLYSVHKPDAFNDLNEFFEPS
jgi:hypothetical protein